MAENHKLLVLKFAEVVNANEFNNLDQIMEPYVEKIGHGQVFYKNLDEAKEYYAKEHKAHPAAEWKVMDFQQDDKLNDTLTARLSCDGVIFHTTYTFSSAGKIEKIHSVPEHHGGHEHHHGGHEHHHAGHEQQHGGHEHHHGGHEHHHNNH